MTKPREFWIDLREHSARRGQGKTNRFTAWKGIYPSTSIGIKVIEKSVYDELLKENEVLKGKLNDIR